MGQHANTLGLLRRVHECVCIRSWDSSSSGACILDGATRSCAWLSQVCDGVHACVCLYSSTFCISCCGCNCRGVGVLHWLTVFHTRTRARTRALTYTSSPTRPGTILCRRWQCYLTCGARLRPPRLSGSCARLRRSHRLPSGLRPCPSFQGCW